MSEHPRRRLFGWVLLAVAGLAIAVALSVAASNLSTQPIGLSGESLRPGERLAPAAEPTPTTAAQRRRTERRERERTGMTRTQTSTSPTVTEDSSGSDGNSGRGRGRGRGRGGDEPKIEDD